MGKIQCSRRYSGVVVFKVWPECAQVKSAAEAESANATVEPATGVNAMANEEMKEWKKAD